MNPLSRRWLAILRSQPRTNHFAYSVPSYSLISDKTFCIRFLLAVSFSMYPAVMNTRFALTLLVFHFSSWGHSLAGDWKSDLPTGWGGHLFRRFCKPFSESSQAVGLYCSCQYFAANFMDATFQRTASFPSMVARGPNGRLSLSILR